MIEVRSASMPWVLGVAVAWAGPAAPPEPTTYDPSRSLAPLVRSVSDAVVKIEVRTEAPPMLGDPHFFPPQDSEGSGFVLSGDGLVLTNFHVVSGSIRIEVEWGDGTLRPARILGGDAALDVALLQVDGCKDLPYVEFGDSDHLEVGDWVVAMGNGLGLGTTVTTGIVSGKGRALGKGDPFSRDDFIQTDAAINEGNSGGPLFDLDGHVVGMSTAIIAGANTVGFAIPSNAIRPILGDLQSRGKVSRGFLGAMPQTLNAELRQALGVKSPSGVVVTSVFDGTPASKSGLERGDVVLSIDGKPVASDREWMTVLGAKHPGDQVVLEVERDAQVRTLSVTLTEHPGTSSDGPAPSPPTQASPDLGLTLAEVTPEVAAKAGIPSGVRIQRVAAGSRADGRLESGDLIVQIDRHAVRDPQDVQRLLARAGDKGLVFLVLRDDEQAFVAIPEVAAK
jgi:serine protease Do